MTARRRKLGKREQRLRNQAMLLGPEFAPIIEAFDKEGVTAEDLLAVFLQAWDPYGADRFVRLKEAMHISGLPRATLYRQMKAGTFPQNVILDESEKVVGWHLPEIRAWLRERARSP